MSGDNDKLFKFLETYPTQIHCLQCSNISVFCNSSSSDDVVHEKIKSAFCNVNLNDGLIQFWSPLQSGLLSTLNQPFSLDHLDSCFITYRIRCLGHVYTVDDDVDKPHCELEMEIRSGGPVTAFINHMPSVLNKGSSLEFGFTSFYLPVFYNSSCVGVVESSIETCDRILPIYKTLITALQMVGLHTFHLQDARPYKTIPGLKSVVDELDSALHMVHESHGFTLSQVWISNENETKQKFGIKLVGHCADSDPSFIKDYHDTCHIFPLIMADGITGKTLQTHQPHFCRDIDELKNNGLLALIPRPVNTGCSCLSICLRSIDTGDVDYVFEFLWPVTRNYHILLTSLLLTLNMCLPSFNLASGARILGNDDELQVVDVENSTGTGTGTGFFKIPRLPKLLDQGKITPISLPRKNASAQNELTRNHILGKCNVVTFAQREQKRKHSASSDSDSETSTYNHEFAIAAEFKENIKLFHMPSSLKHVDLLEKIENKFKCARNTYRLNYLYHSKPVWIDLSDEGDWKACVTSFSSRNITDLQVRVESTA